MESFNYASRKDALEQWGDLLTDAEQVRSNVKKKVFRKSSSNSDFSVLSSGIYRQVLRKGQEPQDFRDGYRDLVGRVCVGSFDDGTFIYTDGSADKGVETTLVQVTIKSRLAVVSFPEDRPLKRIGLNVFDIAHSAGRALSILHGDADWSYSKIAFVELRDKSAITPEDALFLKHGADTWKEPFALTQKYGYSHLYLYGFQDGLQARRSGATSACTPFHEEGRLGYEDGKRIREIILAYKKSKESFARPSFPKAEWFPDDFIKPMEYSYCSRCGHDYTLMECGWRDRPLCPFCGPCRDHGVPAPTTFISKLKHSVKYKFNRRYRDWVNSAQAVKDAQEEQKKQARLVQMRRYLLAKYRKDVVQLPRLFWEVNLDDDRHCNRCGHVDESNVLWNANGLYFAFCGTCLKDERGCWKVVRNETARIKKEKESRKRR